MWNKVKENVLLFFLKFFFWGEGGGGNQSIFYYFLLLLDLSHNNGVSSWCTLTGGWFPLSRK